MLIGPTTTRLELAEIISKMIMKHFDDEPSIMGLGLGVLAACSVNDVKSVITKLGFVRDGVYWKHPNTKLFVKLTESPRKQTQLRIFGDDR